MAPKTPKAPSTRRPSLPELRAQIRKLYTRLRKKRGMQPPAAWRKEGGKKS